MCVHQPSQNKPNELTLLVLAAGVGRRYGGIKQIDPVGPYGGGELIIDYSVYDALRAGFRRAVFVIRRDIETDFKKAIGERLSKVMQIHYAYQELDTLPEGFKVPPQRKKPWGTGHALLVASHLISGPFAGINADDYYGRDAYRVLADYFKIPASPDDYAMVAYTLRKTLSPHGAVSRALCSIDKEGFLSAITEIEQIEPHNGGAKYIDLKGRWNYLTGDETVSMNFWGFRPSIFKHLREKFHNFIREKISNPEEEFLIPSVMSVLIKERRARVRVLNSKEKWFGVTYREDKPYVIERIRRLVDEGLYPKRLWE